MRVSSVPKGHIWRLGKSGVRDGLGKLNGSTRLFSGTRTVRLTCEMGLNSSNGATDTPIFRDRAISCLWCGISSVCQSNRALLFSFLVGEETRLTGPPPRLSQIYPAYVKSTTSTCCLQFIQHLLHEEIQFRIAAIEPSMQQSIGGLPTLPYDVVVIFFWLSPPEQRSRMRIPVISRP